MEFMLIALARAITLAAITRPAPDDPEQPDGNKADLETVEKVLAQSDRDTRQIGVGVAAGSKEERS
jgi:hypothetical protein